MESAQHPGAEISWLSLYMQQFVIYEKMVGGSL